MATSDTERYQANLRDELDGAELYTQIAAAERDPVRKDLFLQLAQAEAKHARVWREKLEAAGIAAQPYVPSFHTRLLARLAHHFGPHFVMPTIAAAEFSDRDKYATQPDARSISAEERGHAAVVQEIVRTQPGGSVTGSDIARAEHWHRGASGNNLRAAVLGANDGLVSNFCLIMGIAGAGTANRIILLTGLAGLVAGACSMALGEWLSVTNARELALIYQAKGLPKADAQRMAAELMTNKQAALDTLAREELGIDPHDLGGNPLSAAAMSFALFSAGAIFPVLPFIWLHGRPAILTSIAASGAALCGVGLLTSLFNGRSPAFSALRQVVFGCAAAAVTYGIGALLGVSLS